MTSATPIPSAVLLSGPEVLSRRHLPSMLLLAMGAGAVNAGAFAVCDRFVTHVTGTVTRIGVDAGQWLLMLEYTLVLGAFVVGAMASVFFIQGRALKGKRALYALPPVCAAAILLLVAALGEWGAYGPIGMRTEEASDFLFLGTLAFGMGLLNAGVASSTALAVRTTHMTGPASDFGVSLATAWLTCGVERKAALQVALLRGGKLSSFVLGAALMFPLVAAAGYLAFVAPALALLAATARSFLPTLARSTSSLARGTAPPAKA